MKPFRSWTALAVAGLLGACAHLQLPGSEPSIRTGMTQVEVTDAFGQPTSTATDANGNPVWTYHRMTTVDGDGSHQVKGVMVTFSNSAVISVEDFTTSTRTPTATKAD